MQYINLASFGKNDNYKRYSGTFRETKSGYTSINFLSYDKSFVVMLESFILERMLKYTG